MLMTDPGFFALARDRHGGGSVGSRLETRGVGLAVQEQCLFATGRVLRTGKRLKVFCLCVAYLIFAPSVRVRDLYIAFEPSLRSRYTLALSILDARIHACMHAFMHA